MRLALPTALLCALSWSLAACAAPPAAPAPASAPAPRVAAPADLQASHQQLLEAVGDAVCEADADCRTVGVGQRACGGPVTYLPYSTRGGREAAILAAAKTLKDAQAADNQASGRLSDCRAVLDPGAQCVARRCQLRAGTPGQMPVVAQ